jgi:predicted GH43/DUF377 family glycosyl hydrolase
MTMRGVMDSSRYSAVAVILSVLLVATALPFGAITSTASSGTWTDLLDEETKMDQKSNVVVSGDQVAVGAMLSTASAGTWVDFFDDETKIAQKGNVIVSGGDVSLGTNGNEWYRHGVVVNSGPPGSGFWKVLHPTVLRDGNGLFRMWFTSREVAPSLMQRINYATSTDGKNWNRYGIVIGENASQEDRVYAPTVIEDGGIFKMWYVGDDFDPPFGARIFYATSPDGLTWTRQGLVMDVGFEGAYDTSGLNFPCVMKEGSTYKMWYSGYDGSNYRILYATSLDGQSWTSRGMVMDNGGPGSLDAVNVIEITIDRDPSGLYHAWYMGSNPTGQTILNATSIDGVTWTKKGESLRGLPGTLEAVVATGSVMISPTNAISLWYIGHDGGGIYRIFLANYSKYGYIVTEPIGPFVNGDWESFFANKTDPSTDAFVRFSVIDGMDWSTIEGYRNLSASSFSLASIDTDTHPVIRLRADFWDLSNNPASTPLLHDWAVTWVDSSAPTEIEAEVECGPQTLNMGSMGQWITCYIELPLPYDPRDIDANTILMNGVLAPELDPRYGFVSLEDSYIVDHDEDGIEERLVKFDREAVQDIAIITRQWEITLTGELFDRTDIVGYEVIRTIYPQAKPTITADVLERPLYGNFNQALTYC